MLKLMQSEFLKLRRRKLIWLMLPAALVMPLFALLYFRYLGQTGVEPIRFYKWSAFGYSLWIILPVILGILCTILMYSESQSHILDQLWLVPVNKMGYFFSKFFIVLLYSVSFMLINAAASVVLSILSGCVALDWSSVFYLLEKCLEAGIITAFAMLPILAVAAAQKGYMLPVCITLVYTLFGFMFVTVNMYCHPLSSMAAILTRKGDISGIALTQAIDLPLAFLCIFLWDIASIIFAGIALAGRKQRRRF